MLYVIQKLKINELHATKQHNTQKTKYKQHKNNNKSHALLSYGMGLHHFLILIILLTLWPGLQVNGHGKQGQKYN